jgi:hypothetical protein
MKIDKNNAAGYINKKEKAIKEGARIIAITSGPITRKNRKKELGTDTLTVGVIGRRGAIEGILSCYIECDGNDATRKIIHMISKSRFKEQIKIIALNGIALAGLNVVNVDLLEKKLKVDVIIITRDKPRPSKLLSAIEVYRNESITEKRNLNADEKRLLVKRANARNIFHEEGFYIQTRKEIGNIRSNIVQCFELLRLSHIIARGVKTGESRGRI